MNKGIQSASVSVQKEAPFTELRFHPGINILWGADAEDVVLTLADIFGGIPSLNGKAEIQWDADALLFVNIIDGACGVEKANVQRGRAAHRAAAAARGPGEFRAGGGHGRAERHPLGGAGRTAPGLGSSDRRAELNGQR